MSNRALQIAAWCLLWSPALAADASQDLLEAARKGQRDQVAALLAKGAAIETRDKDGRTPLMLAAQYGRASTVELLLSKGAKPEARDKRGWNAFMLTLMAPSGGVVRTALVHASHEAVLKLLPHPKRSRVAVEASWAPANAAFSSCFMRPEQLFQHIGGIHPDVLMVEALQRFAATSGRDLLVLHAGLQADSDATLTLRVEPGVSCVQQSDQLSLLIHAKLVSGQEAGSREGGGQEAGGREAGGKEAARAAARQNQPLLERDFGGGVKTGMRGEMAANPNQHAPLLEAWAKSQAGPLYWSVVTALMQSTE